jgi:hypothetical protein
MTGLYGPDDPDWEVDDAAYEEYAAQRRTELAAEFSGDAEPGPEPGTREWHIATGNYIDPEPDWDAGEPYLDHAHGVAYYDTVAAMEAGRERWPEYRHVSPESERDAEAGLWHRSPSGSGTG